jgi:hypothetical protein
MVTPQTRSLLSAAISAADHGYFDDAELLLRDALDAEFMSEIALAITAIERRDPSRRSLDLRPELRSLFAPSETDHQGDHRAVAPSENESIPADDFWSEVVIDFDEIPEAPGTQGNAVSPVTDTDQPQSQGLSQPNIEPGHLERSASSRARYAAASPAPPPPAHRRTTQNMSLEAHRLHSDELPPSGSNHDADSVSTLYERSPSRKTSTLAVAPDDFDDFDFDDLGGAGSLPEPQPQLAQPLRESSTIDGRQQSETPFLPTEAVQASVETAPPELVYVASERDTVMVEAVPELLLEREVQRVTGTPVSEIADSEEQPVVTDASPSTPESAHNPVAKDEQPLTATAPIAELKVTPSSSSVYPQQSSGPQHRTEIVQEPEFQTEERSARFRVAQARAASRHTSTERPYRQIHSGVDAAEGRAPTREILGGTLAPKPVDVSAELKLLGRRILKRNMPNIQAARASITPRSMFLLDQIDGYSTVEDIVDVTGLPAHDAYTLIRQLVDKGLVYFD